MQNGSTFYAFSSIHNVGNILGIAPFKLKVAPKKSKTVLNYFSFSLSVFYTIVYIFSLAYIIITDEILKTYGNGVPGKFSYVEVANIYAGGVTVATLIYFRFTRYINLAISFEYFNEIEELFKVLGCAINYQKLKSKLTRTITSQTVGYLCYLTFIAYYDVDDLPADLPLLYVTSIPSYQIAVGRFICSRYIYIIWLTLCKLNKAIRNILTKQVSRETDNFKADEHIFYFGGTSKKATNGEVLQELDLIWKAYAIICDSSFVLDEYYSGAIFSIIFMSFINTLFGTFQLLYMFIAMWKGYGGIQYQNIVVRFVRIIGNSFNLFSIIDICTSCEKEVTK